MALFSFFNSSSAYSVTNISIKNSSFTSNLIEAEASNTKGRATGTYIAIRLVSFALFIPFVSNFSNSTEFVNFDRSFYTKGITTTDLFVFSYLPVFSISIITISVVLFALPLPHGGELTRFLHRVTASYLLFHLFVFTNGFALRFEDVNNVVSLIAGQNDLLFSRFFHFLSTFFLVAFFYGVSERFIFSRAADIEFPLLVLLLHIGGLLAVHLPTLIDLLLALEIVTLGSYVLLAAERQNRFSTYSGVQAFLLGSVPSARLLLGFGLLYFQSGSLSLSDLDLLFGSTVGISTALFSKYVYAPRINTFRASTNVNGVESFTLEHSEFSFIPDELFSSLNPITSVSVRALIFVLFNFLFKLTAAPFHVWAPSVYGKGPIASVALLSIYAKIIRLFLRYKLFSIVFSAFPIVITPLLLTIAVFSILIGRVGAFISVETKPFFVYSSIGHVGFRLVGVSLFTLEGSSATFHYLPVYIFSSLVSWFILLSLSRKTHHISSLGALRFGEPVRAIIFGLLLFSRSGLPPIGGFFVKLDTFSALLDSGHSFVAYFLFLITVSSFVYYLRVVKVLFFDAGDASKPRISGRFTYAPRFCIRLWVIGFIRIILLVYIVFVNSSILAVQAELLRAIL